MAASGAVVALASAVAAGGGSWAAAQAASKPLVSGDITTVAGGVGGPAVATSVAVSPRAVLYGGGNLYVADRRENGGSVREVSPSTGNLTTPAGTNAASPLVSGTAAASAGLNPTDVAMDHSGNLVITTGNQVAVVAPKAGTFYGQTMAAGDVYVVAGKRTSGNYGNKGEATNALLRFPYGVAVDSSGNLVIADTENNEIRVVAATTGTFYGQSMKAGHIYLVAGDGTAGSSGLGGAATSAELSTPEAVAVDGYGNILIADTGSNEILVVAEQAMTMYGQSMTSGDIYSIAGTGTPGFAGDGASAIAADLDAPEGVAVDGSGNVLIADTGNDRVRVVAEGASAYGQTTQAGDIYTVAGDGTAGFAGDAGPATSAELDVPGGVAVDKSGDLLIADTGNDRVRVVAATAETLYGQSMSGEDIYTVAGNGSDTVSGSGGPATAAELSSPADVAADKANDLVVTDQGDSEVLVSPASSETSLFGQPMTAGDIYDVAGDGTAGFSGEGGPGASAELSQPSAAVADSAGNLVIADTGNNRIRVVAATTGTYYGITMTAGDIYTVAGTGTAGFSGDAGPATGAELNQPEGVAVDTHGNLVIADTGNDRIRVLAEKTAKYYGVKMTAGDIYTVAGGGTALGDGGPATSAQVFPDGVAVDHDGNLVIADTGDNRIRVVAGSATNPYGMTMTAGHIYTIAGDGTEGYAGDGGAATSAELAEPQSVAVNSAGDVLVADTDNDRVRLVAFGSATSAYGQSVTSGDIYTVAGNGTLGFAGDGGPATKAELCSPQGVGVDAAGDLLIADSLNARVREVSA